MEAEKKKDNRISLHLPPETEAKLRRLAARNGTDLSKEIRRAIDAYLDIEVAAENIDMINGVIHQELEAQIKALGNRLAAMLNRLTIISAAGYYTGITTIAELIDTDRYSSFEKIEAIARKKALAYANSKNAAALRSFADDEAVKKIIADLGGGTERYVDFNV